MCLLYVFVIQQYSNQYPFNALEYTRTCLVQCTPRDNHQQRLMPTDSMTCAYPCPPMLFKLRPCIQKLWNVYQYPPTPSLGWIGQIKSRSLSLERFLVSVFPSSEKFDSNLELDAGMHKTGAHPTPMGMGMGTQCRALCHPF